MAYVVCELRVQQSNKCEPEQAQIVQLDNSSKRKPGHNQVSNSSQDVTAEGSGAGCPDRVPELEAEIAALHKELHSSALNLEKLQHQHSIPKLPWDAMWMLKEKLGEGASGTVYRANNACFPNCVVKKGLLAAIRRETETLCFLNHPSIVRMYAKLDIDEEDEQGRVLGCLALQRLGPSLADLLEDPNQTFGLQQLVVGFQGLAAGLAHMHSKGLVDQDVHAGNVLLAMDGSAFVKADLGSAAPVELDGRPNRRYASMCCIGTEAPEIAHSILEHNWYEPKPISDGWALGLLMLTLMGAAGPAAHAELHDRKEYKEDLRDNKSPKESAAIKEYFEYLQQLLPSHGQTSFVQQIAFPELFIEGPKTCVARQLRHVAEMCLCADPTKRPTASKVAAALYKIMRQQGWSDDLAELEL